MIRSPVASNWKSQAAGCIKLRAPHVHSSTVATALPLPLADIPTITCTTTKGQVTCVDERGDGVVGSRLKELQAILKPITDAPVVKEEPKVKEVKADSKAAVSKPVVEANSASKPAETKLVADAAAVLKSEKPAAVTPAVADTIKPEAKPATTDTEIKKSVEAKPAVADPGKPAVVAAVAIEKSADKPAQQAAQAAPKPQTVASDKPSEPAKPVEKAQINVTASESATKPTTPPTSDTVKVVPDSSKPTTSATPDSAKPPAPVSPAPSTTDVSFTSLNNLAQSPAMSRGKPSAPVTLATPDLASSPERRALAVAGRGGNDDTAIFSTAPAGSSGNSPLALDAPASRSTAVMRSTGRWPGNIDPADFLPSEEFSGVVASVGSVTAPSLANAKLSTISVLNDRGLVPGNLPHELADILSLVNAVNNKAVKSLDMRVFPGNVPPDAPATPTILEFAPGNSDGKDVKGIQLQLTPGNIGEGSQLGDLFDFLDKQQKGA